MFHNTKEAGDCEFCLDGPDSTRSFALKAGPHAKSGNYMKHNVELCTQKTTQCSFCSCSNFNDFSTVLLMLLPNHACMLTLHPYVYAVTELSTRSTSLIFSSVGQAAFACLVNPLRILSTLSTITASMPSLTCCCTFSGSLLRTP